jgi:hypothetical protein
MGRSVSFSYSRREFVGTSEIRKCVDGIRVFKAPVRNIHQVSLTALNGIITINLISIHFYLVGSDIFLEKWKLCRFRSSAESQKCAPKILC